jgi:pimeloyl-ACP methyl ester carboxylesterase
MIRAAHRLGLVGDATLERARLRYGSRDYREAEGVLRAVLVELLGERYGPLLADIDVPVELVWGSADTAAPLAGAEYAAALLPHAHLEVLEGIGHDVPRDAPDRLRAAVERLVT